MDNDFIKKFKIKSNTIQFKTHSQLDEFVKKLIEIDNDFSKNYKGHWEFLKSFDRGISIITKQRILVEIFQRKRYRKETKFKTSSYQKKIRKKFNFKRK
jgi:hypothetical protein